MVKSLIKLSEEYYSYFVFKALLECQLFIAVLVYVKC